MFMVSLILFIALVAALFVPAIILNTRERFLSWFARYVLSIIPFAYTFLGWQLIRWAYEHGYFNCSGSYKMLHDCIRWDIDFTVMTTYGFFLMLACILVATPVSLWLLLDTTLKHIRSRHFKDNSIE